MNEPAVGKAKDGQHPWLLGELEDSISYRGSPLILAYDSRAIAEAWVERMVQAIRKHDREGLVTVGGSPSAGMAESVRILLAPGGSPSRFRQRPLLS